MRIDSIQLTEGSNISNLTVASGTSFPASPNSAELFFRTDSNITVRGMYVYINGSWDRLASSDALTAPSGTSFPSAATAGDLFYLNSNDSTEGLYAYDGASWNVASGSKPVAVASANGLSGSVDNSSGTITITLTTSVTGILKGNGTAISAASAGDFPTLNQNTTGSAARLTTARAISTTGDVSWTTSFDGSAAASGAATLATVNSSPQTDSFRKITVNGKGLVTATSAVVKSDITALVGINDILPSQTGLANKFLKTDGTNTSWADPSGIPAGSTLQVQYNNAGAFGASANLTFDPTIGLTTTGIFTSQRFGTVGALDLRSATGTLGTPTAISGSTAVGVITFAGYNGSAYDTVASITARTNGTLAGTGAPGFLVLSTTGTGSSVPTQRLKIDSEGNVVVGGVSALVTNATDGFLYVPTTAGTPSGTPTTYTGAAATVVNSSANALYFYSNGAWRSTNAAGSLTGTTLASNVTASSLTSVGTLTSLGVTGSVTAGSFSGSGSGLTNIPNSALVNSSISVVGSTGLNVSGSPVALGGTVTLTNSGVTSIVAGTNITISGATGAVTINASSPNVGVTDDTTTNATVYPTWVTSTTGNLPIKVSSTKTTLNPSTGLFTSSAFSTPGNLTFSGTGNRIVGDFSNSTLTNRVLIQSSTSNSNSTIGILPNGTSVGAAFTSYSTNDPANSSTMSIGTSAGTGYLAADITGTGTYRPMVFNTSGATKMVLDTSGNLGIGVTVPLNDLHVQRDAAMAGAFTSYNSTAAASGSMILQRARGSFASPTAVLVGDTLGKLIFSGASTSSAFINSASIEGTAAENFSATNAGTALVFYTTQVGSVTRTERMRINNAGNIFIGTAALTTSATDGFLQITSMPGQPASVPSSGNTGVFPMVFDSTNNALMFYNNISASWKNVATAATAAAGLLTGTTLASNVVSSSLTSVGTLSTLLVTGAVTASGFRANQGIPSNADSSTNGYAFGADGDTGLFAPGSGATAGIAAIYSNNAEVARFASNLGISTGLNLAFTGTSNRITGDFSTATLLNRPSFQTSVLNGTTTVQVIPNGTGTASALTVFSASDASNSAYGIFYSGPGGAIIGTSATGTGGATPLQVQTGGAVRATFDTSGNLAFQASGSAVTNVVSHNGGQLAGFRNRIINGAMLIDQRYGGASVTPSVDSYVLDRWKIQMSQASKLSVQCVVAGPPGFYASTKITVASAFTSSAADYFLYRQPIEANNVSDFQLGTANAKTFSVSFWITCSVPGTYSGSINNNGSSRSYPFTYTASTGWSLIKIIIPGDVAGTWETGGILTGLNITFDLGSGSNYKGAANTWASANYTGVTGSASLVANAGATWNLTGVQIELGSVATTFEQRSIGAELMLCQRYLEMIENIYIGYSNTAGNLGGRTRFAVTKRTSPTVGQIQNNVSVSQVNISTTTSTYIGVNTEGVSFYRTATSTAGTAQYSEICVARAEY